MIITEKIQQDINQFLGICQRHKVDALYAFGSSVNEQFNPGKSDIDLMVTIKENDPVERGELLLSLWDTLEAFFHCRVDLLTESSIKNPVLKENINRTKVLIYDGREQQDNFYQRIHPELKNAPDPIGVKCQ